MALIDKNVSQLPGASALSRGLFCASAADALLIAGQAWVLASAVQRVWNGQALAAQTWLLVLFIFFLLLRQGIDYLKSRKLAAFSQARCSELRLSLASRFYDQGRSLLAQEGSAALSATLIEGIAQIGNYLELHLPRCAELIVIPSVLSLCLLAIDPISGVIGILILPCIFFYMRLLGSLAKERAGAKLASFQRMANRFSDTLQGMPVIKYFGRGKALAADIFQSSEEFRDATVATMRSATLSSLVLDLFRVFALAAVAIMLGFRLMAGAIGLQAALAVLIIVPELFAAVRRYASDFHANLDGRKQLQSVLDYIGDKPSAVAAPAPAAPAPAAPASSSHAAPAPAASPQPLELELRDVGLRYGGFDALQGINLQLGAPLKLGVVGASGAGKSSLAQLLAGFQQPSSGSFIYQGRELSSLELPQWQQRCSFIPQNPHIFHGSIASNIAFYRPDATPQEIAEAAEKAGLSPFIHSLPQGMQTIIGEAGRGISGGQAQRIALARAFLCSQRDVLIFDEPSAHLDIETELALKDAMLELMQGKLVIFCTHRLHWLPNMDRILLLEKGRIAEQGTLSQLQASQSALLRLSRQLQGGEPHDC